VTAVCISYAARLVGNLHFHDERLLLSRGPDSSVTAKKVSDAGGLKGNDFKRFARRGLTERMLGKGVIVVEGLTEFHALPVAARKLEESDDSLQPLDIADAAFFDAESEEAMPKFGTFFKALGLKTFSFYDSMHRRPEAKKLLTDVFDVDCEHAHTGFEALIVSEMSLDRLWAFLDDLQTTCDNGNFTIPGVRSVDAELKKLARSALDGSKGTGWAVRLFEGSTVAELRPTVTGFLKQVYAAFPKPAAAVGAVPPAAAA
jgi:putative ATP-dependent endonuclease of the OLD family